MVFGGSGVDLSVGSQGVALCETGRRARPTRAADRIQRDAKEAAMSKRARKRRSRKGNAANHGKKPNC